MLPHRESVSNAGTSETWEQYEARRLRCEIERRRDQLGRDRLRDRALDMAAVLAAYPEILAIGRALGVERGIAAPTDEMRLPIDQLNVEPPSALLMVTAKTAAPLCDKSLRTWRSWDASGLVPRPVRIGRSKLWSVGELRRWVAAGCPCRTEWEVRK
jgi:hypothetical protein